MEPKIRIAIADNRNLFRSMFTKELKNHPLFDFIGEAQNGRDLLQILNHAHCDIVVIDTEMPLVSGMEILNKIKKQFPETLVIILSEDATESTVCDFILSGAKAYMSKNCLLEDILKTILSVFENGFVYDALVVNALLNNSVKDYRLRTVHYQVSLSKREIQVLKLLCMNNTEKEIAAELNISIHTVHTHKTRIYSKTNSHSIVDLMVYALKNGLIS